MLGRWSAAAAAPLGRPFPSARIHRVRLKTLGVVSMGVPRVLPLVGRGPPCRWLGWRCVRIRLGLAAVASALMRPSCALGGIEPLRALAPFKIHLNSRWLAILAFRCGGVLRALPFSMYFQGRAPECVFGRAVRRLSFGFHAAIIAAWRLALAALVLPLSASMAVFQPPRTSSAAFSGLRRLHSSTALPQPSPAVPSRPQTRTLLALGARLRLANLFVRPVGRA